MKKLFYNLIFCAITLSVNAQIKISPLGGVSLGTLSPANANQINLMDNWNLTPDVSFLQFSCDDGYLKIATLGSYVNFTTDKSTYRFDKPISLQEGVLSSLHPAGYPLYLGSDANKWAGIYLTNNANISGDYITYLGNYVTFNGYRTNTKNIEAISDRTYNLGASGKRWLDVYASNLVISASVEPYYSTGVRIRKPENVYGTLQICDNYSSSEYMDIDIYGTYTEFNTGNTAFKFLKQVYLLDGSLVSSDIRRKENVIYIKDEVSSLEKINKINGIKYNYIDDESKSIRIGFSAQELQIIVPDLVKEMVIEEINDLGEPVTIDTELAVDYFGMIPILLEAIKEQQAEIDELKKSLNILLLEPIK